MEANIKLRRLELSDLPAADRLRHAAGWNQTPADWRRMLALDPEGCFAAVDQNRVVGTATTTSYGSELAWIGMVLVDPEWRNQGIGRRLLLGCLEHLQAKGIRCIKLDATPAGQVLYEKLGFEVEWALARWMKPEGFKSTKSPESGLISPRDDNWAEIEELEQQAIGIRRGKLLRSLGADSSHAVIYQCSDRKIEGFGFLRTGVNADYIGPAMGRDSTAGERVVSHLVSKAQRPLFWDIPDPCRDAVEWAQKNGFVRQRPFVRMFLGKYKITGAPQQLWGISDPATG